MSCAGMGLSFTGLSAVGGMLGGSGLANMASNVANAVSGAGGGIVGAMSSNLSTIANSVVPGAGSIGAIASVASGSGLTDVQGNPITALTGLSTAGPGLMATAGKNVLSGALTGATGSGFSLGSNFISSMTGHASELFGTGPIQMSQMLGIAEGFAGTSLDLAAPVFTALQSEFGINPAAISQVFPAGGDFGNFLGSAISDLQGAVTNGISTLVTDVSFLPDFASDLANMGTAFNLGDISNFGNPGQLINAILENNAGGITGITDILQTVGINPNAGINLASPEFNDVLNEALSTITDPRLIQNAQSILGSQLQGLESLADFTDLPKVMQASFDNIPFDNFNQLAGQLANTELGTISKPTELASLVQNTVTANLGSIAGTTKVIDSNAIDRIQDAFMRGTGQYGNITTEDIAGSIGGIAIKPSGNIVAAGLNILEEASLFDDLRSRYNELQTGVSTLSYLDNPDSSLATAIIDPFDSYSHASLDSFVGRKREQIDAELASIASNSSFSSTFANMETEYRKMQQKIVDEKYFATKVDLQLDLRNEDAINAYYFGDSMQQRVNDPGTIPMVEGMAEASVERNDYYGEYWRAFIAECKNKDARLPYDTRWIAERIEEV